MAKNKCVILCVIVDIQFEGKVYTACLGREKKWEWLFGGGHDYVRGEKIPVPAEVLAKFQTLHPGVKPVNRSKHG